MLMKRCLFFVHVDGGENPTEVLADLESTLQTSVASSSFTLVIDSLIFRKNIPFPYSLLKTRAQLIGSWMPIDQFYLLNESGENH